MTGETTRAQLLRAAAGLIGEFGWAAVSTRGIAERAGVPHGAVSYHFNGKAELLREAALEAIEEFLTRPAHDLLEQDGGVRDAIISSAKLAEIDNAKLAVVAEALMQAPRDAELRRRLAEQIRGYRDALTERVARDIQAGTVVQGVDPRGVAVIVTAMLDGLFLHAAADPEVDIALGCQTLATLLAPGDRRGQ